MREISDTTVQPGSEVISTDTYHRERILGGCQGLLKSFSKSAVSRQWVENAPLSRQKSTEKPESAEDAFMIGLVNALEKMPNAVPDIFVPLTDIVREHKYFESIHGSFFKEKIRYSATITVGKNSENVGVLLITIHGPTYLDRYMISMPTDIRITARGDLFVGFALGHPVWKKATEVLTNSPGYQPTKTEVMYSSAEQLDTKEQATFDALFETTLKVLDDITSGN